MGSQQSRFRFETERLKDGPMAHEFSHAPALFDLLDDPEYLFEDPVTGSLKLTLVGDTVILQGIISTVASAPCGRCLERIRIPLKAQVTLAFINDPRLLDRESHPELDEENTYYFDGEFVHPMEPMRELLLLELPPIPACVLDPGDICPIHGGKMGARVFGPPEDTAGEKKPPGNTLQEQMERLRRQLEG